MFPPNSRKNWLTFCAKAAHMLHFLFFCQKPFLSPSLRSAIHQPRMSSESVCAAAGSPFSRSPWTSPQVLYIIWFSLVWLCENISNPREESVINQRLQWLLDSVSEALAWELRAILRYRRAVFVLWRKSTYHQLWNVNGPLFRDFSDAHVLLYQRRCCD